MKHSDQSCVMTINSGSTSVKLAAFKVRAQTVTEVSRVTLSEDARTPREALSGFLAGLPDAPDAIAHRVVHGGQRFTAPVKIDSNVATAIKELSELAPLHNPKALEWIDAARQVADAAVVQVAAFDTAFFSSLPRVAAEYALASRYGVDEGVRRYGFHGLAHQALWQRWSQLHPDLPQGGRVITLQMGGGVSAAAMDRGHPLDTSMGFSPLEGLMMATRSGDVDPAIIPYLQKRLGKTSEQVVELLNHDSGVAGTSSKGTNLGTLAADPTPQAQFAVDLYCYRLRKCIGAYCAVLGGCDGIVFGGGVGEHVPAVRQRILTGMAWAGIEIDQRANDAARGHEARLDTGRLTVAVHVIPVEEERVLVEAARTIMAEVH